MLEAYRKVEEAVSRLLLAACVVLVVVASLGRWLGHPIIWSVDMAQLLFVWICILGANQAMRRNQHVGVDLLLIHLPAWACRWITALHYLLIEGFLAAMVVFGTRLSLLNVQREFGDTPVSYAWVTIAVPVGSALLFLTILGKLVVIIAEERAERGKGNPS